MCAVQLFEGTPHAVVISCSPVVIACLMSWRFIFRGADRVTTLGYVHFRGCIWCVEHPYSVRLFDGVARTPTSPGFVNCFPVSRSCYVHGILAWTGRYDLPRFTYMNSQLSLGSKTEYDKMFSSSRVMYKYISMGPGISRLWKI